jgi:hypothetical protein
MTEAKPVEKAAHTRAVDCHAAPFQLHTEFVQRQFAVLRQPLADEVGMRGELACSRPMPLPPGRKRTRLGLQLHQIVHEPRRNMKTTCCLTVAMSFLNKRNNAHSQLDRMRLAHRGSPSTAMNHQTFNL